MKHRKRRLEYVPRIYKKRKKLRKQSADISIELFATKEEPYSCAGTPFTKDLAQIAKDVEQQGEYHDADEIARQEDVERRLNQGLRELRGELDRLNSTDEAPFLFKENTYILMYAPYFKDDDGRETKFNFCLLDCHKMEWKTLDIELDEKLERMIVMDDQIYFLNEKSFFKLNLETMESEQLPPMKLCCTFDNNYLAVNNCLWIFGGWDKEERKPVNCVEMYDPVTNEWIEKPPLRYEQAYAKYATVNDKVFVCGGSGLDWENHRTIEVFDLNSETWTLLNTEIPFDSIHFRVAALDNFLMFCKRTVSKTKTWKLNIDTLEWTELPSIIACTSRRELIRIEDKLVHIGKIYRSHDEKEPIRVDIFDGQRWIIAASLNCGAELFNNVVVRSPTLIDKLVSLVVEE